MIYCRRLFDTSHITYGVQISNHLLRFSNVVARLLNHDRIRYFGNSNENRQIIFNREKNATVNWMDGLVEVIQKSTNLRHLELTHLFLLRSDLSREFFDALANNQTIKILDLNRNKITDREATCLADGRRVKCEHDHRRIIFALLED